MVTVYVIKDVPAITPVTSPVDASTDATAGLPLDHVPPEVVLVHSSEEPVQIVVVPVMVWVTDGVTVTVLVAVLRHPPEETA